VPFSSREEEHLSASEDSAITISRTGHSSRMGVGDSVTAENESLPENEITSVQLVGLDESKFLFEKAMS
jgi:hypothetical protein